jgi:hypothetical protein
MTGKDLVWGFPSVHKSVGVPLAQVVSFCRSMKPVNSTIISPAYWVHTASGTNVHDLQFWWDRSPADLQTKNVWQHGVEWGMFWVKLTAKDMKL